MNIKIPIHS